jgi:hypothetical protein
LTGDNYDKAGGLQGLIEDAAERALRGPSSFSLLIVRKTPRGEQAVADRAAGFSLVTIGKSACDGIREVQ